MPRRRVKQFIAAVAALLALAALVYAFLPRPVSVDLAEVSRSRLEVTIGGEGKTRVKEVYVVSAPVTGRTLRLAVHAGDAVVGGKTELAVMQPAEPQFLDVRTRAETEARVQAAEAATSLAEARLARARAELEFAAADLRRARTLASKDNISRRELERAELASRTRAAEVATEAAAVKQAAYELESARATLRQPGAGPAPESCCVTLVAPTDGAVLRVLTESEAVVAVGTPLLEIGDPRDLEIVVDLLSTDAVQVQPGAAVVIEHWGGPTVLQGRVRLVEPFGFTKVSALGIEEQRVNVIIDLVDPPELRRSLGHGFRVETRIVVWEAPDVLQVPVSALFRADDGWAVFAAVEGRARLRPVTLGRRNSLSAEAVAGVAAGDLVIMHPTDKVAEGSRIVGRAAR